MEETDLPQSEDVSTGQADSWNEFLAPNTVSYDTDADALVEAVAVDTDADTRLDTVLLDSNSDTLADTALLDTNADGAADAADTVLLDTNADAVPDTPVPAEAFVESTAPEDWESTDFAPSNFEALTGTAAVTEGDLAQAADDLSAQTAMNIGMAATYDAMDYQFDDWS